MADALSSFVSNYLTQTLGYLAVAGLLFLSTWVLGRQWLACRRIEVHGRRFEWAQLGHELRNTLVALAIGTLQLVVVMWLRDQGWARLSDDIGSVGWAVLCGVALVLFNDLWFYAVHRTLHTPWLFRNIHAIHHRSVDVNPFSSYSFHAVEAILVTGWFIPVALVFPIPLPVLGVVQVLGLANNLMAHLGYELLPYWWTRVPVIRWTNSATFHSLHHSRYRGNYGLFTRIWDRLFGTEIEGYESAFAAAHAHDLAARAPQAHNPLRRERADEAT